MSTKIITRLNRIPDAFKNDRLELKGVLRMVVLHKTKSNFTRETEAFIRRYLPATKYNNPTFDFRRVVEDQYEMPVIQLFDRELKLRETIETGSLSETQIFEKVRSLDARLASV